jgi:hypothetical protein
LTLGTILAKRVEKDVYKVSSGIGKKKVKKVSKKKPSAKKVTRKVSKKPSAKKVTRKVSKKPSAKKVTRKVVKKEVSVSSKSKWQPLTNSDIRKLMKKGQKGGTCGSGLCGDVALKPFNGCKRPDWGVADWTEPACI